jgi:hypothetical protein
MRRARLHNDRGRGRFDAEPDLHRVQAPTTVLCGAADPFYSDDPFQRTAAGIPHGRSVMMPGKPPRQTSTNKIIVPTRASAPRPSDEGSHRDLVAHPADRDCGAGSAGRSLRASAELHQREIHSKALALSCAGREVGPAVDCTSACRQEPRRLELLRGHLEVRMPMRHIGNQKNDVTTGHSKASNLIRSRRHPRNCPHGWTQLDVGHTNLCTAGVSQPDRMDRGQPGSWLLWSDDVRRD